MNAPHREKFKRERRCVSENYQQHADSGEKGRSGAAKPRSPKDSCAKQSESCQFQQSGQHAGMLATFFNVSHKPILLSKRPAVAS